MYRREHLHKLVAVLLIAQLVMSPYISSLPIPVYRYLPKDLSLVIPIEYGHIKKIWNGTGKEQKPIVLIEDAHCMPEAQYNIHQILNNLSLSKRNSLLCVEGAQGPLHTQLFKEFPDKVLAQEAIESFIHNGVLSGVEGNALINAYPAYGVERSTEYVANLGQFREVYYLRSSSYSFFEKLEKSLSILKEYYYSEELSNYDRAYRSYKKGEVSITEFFHFLCERDEYNTIIVDEKYYPLQQLSKLKELEEHIDIQEVEKEHVFLLKLLAEKASRFELQTVLKKGLLYRAKKEHPLTYYNLLDGYRKKYIPVDSSERFTQLENYIRLLEQSQKINFLEVDSCIEESSTLFSRRITNGPQQKKILELSEKIFLLERLCSLGLNRKEWRLLKTYDVVKFFEECLESITHLLHENGHISELIIEEKMVLASKELISKSISFYKTAVKRDRILIDETLGQLQKTNKDEAILVVGGFHIEGIEEILQKNNISYAIVTPQVLEAKKTTSYIERMLHYQLEGQPLPPVQSDTIAPKPILGTIHGIEDEFSTEIIQIISHAYRLLADELSLQEKSLQEKIAILLRQWSPHSILSHETIEQILNDLFSGAHEQEEVDEATIIDTFLKKALIAEDPVLIRIFESIATGNSLEKFVDKTDLSKASLPLRDEEIHHNLALIRKNQGGFFVTGRVQEKINRCYIDWIGTLSVLKPLERRKLFEMLNRFGINEINIITERGAGLLPFIFSLEQYEGKNNLTFINTIIMANHKINAEYLNERLGVKVIKTTKSKAQYLSETVQQGKILYFDDDMRNFEGLSEDIMSIGVIGRSLNITEAYAYLYSLRQLSIVEQLLTEIIIRDKGNDGFIARGFEAKELDKLKADIIWYEAQAKTKEEEIFDEELKALVLGPLFSEKKMDILKNSSEKQYSLALFDGVIEGPKKFLLAWRDEYFHTIYIARELLVRACNRSNNVVTEALFHEVHCDGNPWGHHLAIIHQQKKFHANYDDDEHYRGKKWEWVTDISIAGKNYRYKAMINSKGTILKDSDTGLPRPFKGELGKVIKGTINDLLKEQFLKREQKFLVASTFHDIGNELMHVVSFAELLRQWIVFTNSENTRILEQIRTNNDELANKITKDGIKAFLLSAEEEILLRADRLHKTYETFIETKNDESFVLFQQELKHYMNQLQEVKLIIESIVHVHKNNFGKDTDLYAKYERVRESLPTILAMAIEMLEELLDGILSDEQKMEEVSLFLKDIFMRKSELYKLELNLLGFDQVETYIRLNKVHIYRIITNIFQNISDALTSLPKATRNNSVIVSLSIDSRNETVVIQIRDFAGGIPSKDIPHIFSYLYSTKKKGKENRGLGLFMTRKLVKRLGGTITADSEEDIGTTFSITFPLIRLGKSLSTEKVKMMKKQIISSALHDAANYMNKLTGLVLILFGSDLWGMFLQSSEDNIQKLITEIETSDRAKKGKINKNTIKEYITDLADLMLRQFHILRKNISEDAFVEDKLLMDFLEKSLYEFSQNAHRIQLLTDIIFNTIPPLNEIESIDHEFSQELVAAQQEIALIPEGVEEALRGRLSTERAIINFPEYTKRLVLRLGSNHSYTINLSGFTRENAAFIKINRSHFNRIISNLFKNISDALKRIPAQDQNRQVIISLDCDKEEKKVMLRVTDFAGGIKKKDLSSIFTYLYTTKDDRTHQHGIGLFIVKEMVELAQGTIAVTTEEGKGTTFHLTFPLVSDTERLENLPGFRRLEKIVGFTGCGPNIESRLDEVALKWHILRVATVAKIIAQKYGFDAQKAEFIGRIHDYVAFPFRYFTMRGAFGNILSQYDYNDKIAIIQRLEEDGFVLSQDMRNDIRNFNIHSLKNISDEAKITLAAESVEGVIEEILFGLKFNLFSFDEIPESVKALLGLKNTSIFQKRLLKDFNNLVIDITTQLLSDPSISVDALISKAQSIKRFSRKAFISHIFKSSTTRTAIEEVEHIIMPVFKKMVTNYLMHNWEEKDVLEKAHKYAITELSRMTEEEVIEIASKQLKENKKLLSNALITQLLKRQPQWKKTYLAAIKNFLTWHYPRKIEEVLRAIDTLSDTEVLDQINEKLLQKTPGGVSGSLIELLTSKTAGENDFSQLISHLLGGYFTTIDGYYYLLKSLSNSDHAANILDVVGFLRLLLRSIEILSRRKPDILEDRKESYIAQGFTKDELDLLKVSIKQRIQDSKEEKVDALFIGLYNSTSQEELTELLRDSKGTVYELVFFDAVVDGPNKFLLGWKEAPMKPGEKGIVFIAREALTHAIRAGPLFVKELIFHETNCDRSSWGHYLTIISQQKTFQEHYDPDDYFEGNNWQWAEDIEIHGKAYRYKALLDESGDLLLDKHYGFPRPYKGKLQKILRDIIHNNMLFLESLPSDEFMYEIPTSNTILLYRENKRVDITRHIIGAREIVAIGNRLYEKKPRIPIHFSDLLNNPLLWLGNAELVDFFGINNMPVIAKEPLLQTCTLLKNGDPLVKQISNPLFSLNRFVDEAYLAIKSPHINAITNLHYCLVLFYGSELSDFNKEDYVSLIDSFQRLDGDIPESTKIKLEKIFSKFIESLPKKTVKKIANEFIKRLVSQDKKILEEIVFYDARMIRELFKKIHFLLYQALARFGSFFPNEKAATVLAIKEKILEKLSVNRNSIPENVRRIVSREDALELLSVEVLRHPEKLYVITGGPGGEKSEFAVALKEEASRKMKESGHSYPIRIIKSSDFLPLTKGTSPLGIPSSYDPDTIYIIEGNETLERILLSYSRAIVNAQPKEMVPIGYFVPYKQALDSLRKSGNEDDRHVLEHFELLFDHWYLLEDFSKYKIVIDGSLRAESGTMISQGFSQRELDTVKNDIKETETTDNGQEKIDEVLLEKLHRSVQEDELHELFKDEKGSEFELVLFDAVVENSDRFLLGWREYPLGKEQKGKVYIAREALLQAIRAGPVFVRELIFHELQCDESSWGHYLTILLQQQLFPEHYDPDGYFEGKTWKWVEGVKINGNTYRYKALLDEAGSVLVDPLSGFPRPYKGKLQLFLRHLIDILPTYQHILEVF
ncbi:ATP-binding protein, partial [Chlamydiota bacterium]